MWQCNLCLAFHHAILCESNFQLMEEYDEDEIGSLDHEELEGTMNPDSERLNALAEEFIESQQNQE